MSILKKLIPYILSGIFLFSAISKIIAIEYFEQFLYGFGILKLNQSILLARLIIATEFALSMLFTFRIHIKATAYISLALLAIFSGFIGYMELTQSSEDCFCFGTLLKLSNTVSLIKNILLSALIIVLLRTNKNPDTQKYGKLKLYGALVAALGLSFGISFPNNLLGAEGKITYCQPCFKKVIDANQLQSKKVVICFLSTKCKYCQLMAKKMSVIAQKSNNHKDILYILWDKDHNPGKFFKETNSYPFRHQEMFVLDFIELTYGKMPLMVLFNQGKVEKTFRYKDMNEETILKFLQK